MRWIKICVLLSLGWSLACHAGSSGAGVSQSASTMVTLQGNANQPQVQAEGGITATSPTLRPTLPPVPDVASGPRLSSSELKYHILERFPDFFFCDPDFYPVARDDELSQAREHLDEMRADAEMWAVLMRHHGLEERATLSEEQLLAIYRDYKRLRAIQLTAEGDVYRFRILTGSAHSDRGMAVTGWVDVYGNVEIEKQEPAYLICPICLAAGTRIATPKGEQAVETLRPGDLVWTRGENGQKKAAPVQQVVQTAVPIGHHIVHLKLADGRELWVSAGHPTADGRLLGTFKVGERLDGSSVVLSEVIAYDSPFTYDLLPEGATIYWANGIPLQSTLIPLPNLLPVEFPMGK